MRIVSILALIIITLSQINSVDSSRNEHSKFSLSDETPPYLNFAPFDMDINGDHLFVVGNDFHIFNVSDPSNPVWIQRIELEKSGRKIKVTDEYAFVAYEDGFLTIIDINPISSAHIVSEIKIANQINTLKIIHDRIFMACGVEGIFLVDIDPPEIIHVEKIIDTPGTASDILLQDGYLYVADGECGLQIVSIEPLETAFICYSIETAEYALDLDYHNGYLFVLDTRGDSLQVIDLFSKHKPFFMRDKMLNGLDYPSGIYLEGSFAFVPNQNHKLIVIDVANPDSLEIIKEIDAERTNCIVLNHDYAYVGDTYGGIKVIDIQPLQNASVVKNLDTARFSRHVCVSNGNAYITDYNTLIIYDIDPIESTHIINRVKLPADPLDLDIMNGYAYLNYGESVYDYNKMKYMKSCIQIIDIDSIESELVTNFVELPARANNVFLDNEYAYAVMGDCGLSIVDINPIESAQLVKTLDTPGFANDVFVEDNLAYVADGKEGLHIIDIDPPSTAFILNTFKFENEIQKVIIHNGYAIIGSFGTYQVVKIRRFDNFVQEINQFSAGRNIQVHNEYALSSGSGSKSTFKIIHLYTPGRIYEINDFHAKDWAFENSYLYVTDTIEGFRIFRLYGEFDLS